MIDKGLVVGAMHDHFVILRIYCVPSGLGFFTGYLKFGPLCLRSPDSCGSLL